MRVVLDWVANHTSWDNPWLAQHKDWYQQDAAGNVITPPGTNWQDVAALNYKSAEMRSEMIKSMSYWVKQQHVDGFRCDYADGPPLDFWKDAITTVNRAAGKKLFWLAEGAKADYIKAGFDLTYDWETFTAVKDLFHRKLTPKAFIDKAFKPDPHKLRFITNHDIAAWDNSPAEEFGSQEAAYSAWILATMTGGTPLIYSGQEVGMKQKLPFFTRQPIDWSQPAFGSPIEELSNFDRQFPTDQQFLQYAISNPTKIFIQDDTISFERSVDLAGMTLYPTIHFFVNCSSTKVASPADYPWKQKSPDVSPYSSLVWVETLGCFSHSFRGIYPRESVKK